MFNLRYIMVLLAVCLGHAAAAVAGDTLFVKALQIDGPFVVRKPLVLDSLNVGQAKYNADDYADYSIARFIIRSDRYVTGNVQTTGTKKSVVMVDDKEVGNGALSLSPGQYAVAVRYVPSDSDSVSVKITGKDVTEMQIIDCNEMGAGMRPFSMADNMLMSHYSGLSVSPSGRYAFVTQWAYDTGGSARYRTFLIETATGKRLRETDGTWMLKTDRYIRWKETDGKMILCSYDPLTEDETPITKEDLRGYNYIMAPTEDYLILTKSIDGPAKEDGVYEILEMDDRQPGWRKRSEIYRFDLKTGVREQLAYGNKSMWVNDITEDGKYLFLSESHSRLEKRPTEVQSLYRINMDTFKADTIFTEQGFMGELHLIPGTQKFLVKSGAEAFNRIGCILPDSLTPNMYEYQLFMMDAEKGVGSAMPLTKDFIPSISRIVMSDDEFAYFTAEKADSVALYRLDLKTYKIENIDQPCEVIMGISKASHGNTLMYYGNGACTDYRLYCIDTQKLKLGKGQKNSIRSFEPLNKERFSQINFGTCEAWHFKSERGYELTGHAYLPYDYDKNSVKKYPMIVHYYGGCSPTTRRFGGGQHYPAHYWNALGYVVLIVNPSGASGFGQEWGARHVNTAGEGPAQDIIEATKWFAEQHPFVDKDAIGCVSASYGGFMTQWILTKTDMYAAGISHAGISDHTSYWGEGYWGYNYSEISMANSYPWNRKDLYVDRSPLFHADKIHTPLLFTHGTADTNVPPGESIQMFTALKLLGCPTAFVMVEGENHGIMDYHKRQKWINTMTAWFHRYLKKDDSWWNAMYSRKSL